MLRVFSLSVPRFLSMTESQLKFTSSVFFDSPDGNPSRFQSKWAGPVCRGFFGSSLDSEKPLKISEVLRSASALNGGLKTISCRAFGSSSLTLVPQYAQNRSPSYNFFPQLVQNMSASSIYSLIFSRSSSSV